MDLKKLTILMILIVISISILSNLVYANTFQATLHVLEYIPWDDFEGPDGLYELSGIYPQPVQFDNFTLKFVNLTANMSDNISCSIMMSNGTNFTLNKMLASTIADTNYTLNYTLQSGDPSGAYEYSWYVDWCSLNSSVTGYYINETDYPIYVKTDNWYFNLGGLTKSNDAANAYISWKAGARSYFSHHDATEKDILFSVLKYSGVHRFEGNCSDGIDNEPSPFNDSLIDCDDPDCHTVFSIRPNGTCDHPIVPGGTGQFSIDNIINFGKNVLSFDGVATLPTSPCTGNICRFTVGGATVRYTQAISPSGQFKVKVERSIPSAEIVFVTLKNITSSAYTISNANTSIYGSNPLSYKWLVPSDGPPFYTFIASSKPTAASTQTFSGNLNMVMNTTLPGTPQTTYDMDVDIFVGSGKGNQTFTIYTDNNAPDNLFENDTNLQHVTTNYISGTQTTSDQACNDGIDNDLNYDGSDCGDADCNQTQVGETSNGDAIRCEYQKELTCWDGFDNDADGSVDCADNDCNLKIGGYVLGSGAIAKYFVSGANVVACDFPEGTNNYTATGSTLGSCADNFNNDAEDGIDCYDVTACWGAGGTSTDIVNFPCPYFENNNPLWCSDGIDNDFDEFVHSGMRAGYSSDVGIDCDDYDCAGASNCPARETLDASGDTDLSQCFDGIDNDLDGWYWGGSSYIQNTSTGTDCKDPDCAWAINPDNPDEVCPATEFNLAWMNFSTENYNYCDNSKDDDVDSTFFQGGTDCMDANSTFGDTTDCWQRFGACGPCPSQENYTWNSCMDGSNNDHDNGSGAYGGSGSDCRDSQCDGELASMNSAMCEYTGETICNDSFDNDGANGADCADSACNLQTGSDGQTCGAESLFCSDDYDNDANNRIDCLDSACWGTTCAASWGSSSCLTVPSNTTFTLNPAGDISVEYRNRVHIVDDDFIIRFRDLRDLSGASVMLVLGQHPTNNISFNVTTSEIDVLGPDASNFTMTWVDDVLILMNNTSVSSLDLTVKMPVPADTALGTETFPVLSQTTSGQGNGNVQVTVYENQSPIITTIEIEPMNSTRHANIKYGDSVGIRAIPDDSASGGSNICGCYFQINGSTPSLETDCIYETVLTTEAFYNVTVWAVDEPDNEGAKNYTNFTLNIYPVQQYNNDLNKVFSKQDLDDIDIDSSFITAVGDTFGSTCTVKIFNDTHTVYQNNITQTGTSNTAYCDQEFDVPENVPELDGVYWVTNEVTDSDGSTVVSTKKFFFMCDNINSQGVTPSGVRWNCQKADWDNDGVTDGILQPLWAPGYTQYCDNCLDLNNPDQNDTDLDGVGDECDNCVEDWNPGQEDSDRDGIGDACIPEEVPRTPSGGPGVETPIEPMEEEVEAALPPVYSVYMPGEFDTYQDIPMYFSIMNPTEQSIERLVYVIIYQGDQIYYYNSLPVSVSKYSMRNWTYIPGIVYCGMPKGLYDVRVEWFDNYGLELQEDYLTFEVLNDCLVPIEGIWLLLVILLTIMLNIRRCDKCGRFTIFSWRDRHGVRLCPKCRKKEKT